MEGQRSPRHGPLASARLQLTTVVLLGLLVRFPALFAPLQTDEFPVLRSIAGRRSASPEELPSTSNPLLRVESTAVVRERSVLPYGIPHPLPLFNYLEYATIGPLPIAPWSMRLPSLLAGLATIPVVYAACRVWTGHSVAIFAALLAAIEPMQVAASTLARPYALGHLSIALAWLLLQRLLTAADLRSRALWAGGIGVAVALAGWLNPVLLLIAPTLVAAAAAAAVCARAVPIGRPIYPLQAVAGLLAAFSLSALLLSPAWGYLHHLRLAYLRNADYLNSTWPFLGARPRWGFLLEHNTSFIAGLLCLALLPRTSWIRDRAGASAAKWLLAQGAVLAAVPQALALALYAAGLQGAFLSRYLSYTSLGVVILLTAVSSIGAAGARPAGAGALLAASWLLLATHPHGRGFNLDTSSPFWRTSVRLLDDLAERGMWREGDLLLFQPGLLEADLLPGGIPGASHAEVQYHLLSPLSTAHAPKIRLPVTTLSFSLHRGIHEVNIGRGYTLRDRFYDERLAARLKTARRFWVLTSPWSRDEYLACLLPWMADAVGQDLVAVEVAPAESSAFGPEVSVPRGLREDQDIAGLENRLNRRTNALVLVQPAPAVNGRKTVDAGGQAPATR